MKNIIWKILYFLKTWLHYDDYVIKPKAFIAGITVDKCICLYRAIQFILQIHKSFVLIGLLSSPRSPPNIKMVFSLLSEHPLLQPLGRGHPDSGPVFPQSSSLNVVIFKVSSLIKIKSFENPPAPSWPLLLSVTSPPKIAMKFPFPGTWNEHDSIYLIFLGNFH